MQTTPIQILEEKAARFGSFRNAVGHDERNILVRIFVSLCEWQVAFHLVVGRRTGAGVDGLRRGNALPVNHTRGSPLLFQLQDSLQSRLRAFRWTLLANQPLPRIRVVS